jgi:cytochrome c oxidase cbb3-type subunit 2
MKHDIIEKNIGLMIVLIVIAIAWGGLVEVVPLFWDKNTNEPIEGLMPLNATELEGRDIYIREGCHVCHTQMIRPFRAETERYSDEWHRAHLYNPRDVVPESIMPSYPWLFEDTVDGRDTPKKMTALRHVGVPYTDADIEGAKAAVDGIREIEALVAYLQQLGTIMKDKQ